MKYLCLFFIFLGCSSAPDDNVLDNCNKKLRECNSKANKSSCGTEDFSCIKKMLTDPNWKPEDFSQKINQCDTDHQKCLEL